MSKTFISKSDASRYTLGIVYEPEVVDSQGDFAKAEDIEKAAWRFMKVLQANSKLTEGCVKAFKGLVEGIKKGEGNVEVTDIMSAIQKADEDAVGLGVQHCTWGADLGDIVESYIAPCDIALGEQTITKGTWMMGVVWNEDNWSKVQKGEITGYSMGGTGTRIDCDD